MSKRTSKEAIVMMVNRVSWAGKIWDDCPPTEVRDATICFLNQSKGPREGTVILTPTRVPYGLSAETLKKVHLNPANVDSWAFLDDMSESDQQQIRGFIGAQKDIEAAARAQTAGLVLPTGLDMDALAKARRR